MTTGCAWQDVVLRGGQLQLEYQGGRSEGDPGADVGAIGSFHGWAENKCTHYGDILSDHDSF